MDGDMDACVLDEAARLLDRLLEADFDVRSPDLLPEFLRDRFQHLAGL